MIVTNKGTTAYNRYAMCYAGKFHREFLGLINSEFLHRYESLLLWMIYV